MWLQAEISLCARSRGFHLVTAEVEEKMPAPGNIHTGIAHFFIKHSSASLCINENADPTVRSDMEAHFNHMIPENAPYYKHTCEGPDDMPAHLKNACIGTSISIPITNGRLNLGIWQGIYLGEHRDHAGGRCLVVTLQGE